MAVQMVLRHEGGYVNDSKDPGGETKFGISKRAYPSVDIAALTEDTAKAIYKRDYWDKVKGDQLPDSVATVLFDMAVNMGVDRAIKLLQRALRVKEDGALGPVTIQAAKASGVAAKLTTERVLAYTKIANFDTYGRGWVNRSITTALEAKA